MSDYLKLKPIKLTRQQILWIQEWLQRLEEDPASSRDELQRELFRMKKELAEAEVDSAL